MMQDFEIAVFEDALEAYSKTDWFKIMFIDSSVGELRTDLLNNPRVMKLFMEEYWNTRLGDNTSK